MNREDYKKLVQFLDKMQAAGNLEYSIDSPLAPYSSFRIGGHADFIVFPHTREALIRLLTELNAEKIRYDVFGNGSNVLFADEGYRGVVIVTTKMNQIKRVGDTLWADAGVSFTGLAVRALKEGLTGLEFAYGIPGSVGGAIYMNAGAYDGEVAQVCTETTVYTYKGSLVGEVFEVSGDDQEFGYRSSVFQAIDDAVTGLAGFTTVETPFERESRSTGASRYLLDTSPGRVDAVTRSPKSAGTEPTAPRAAGDSDPDTLSNGTVAESSASSR